MPTGLVAKQADINLQPVGFLKGYARENKLYLYLVELRKIGAVCLIKLGETSCADTLIQYAKKWETTR